MNKILILIVIAIFATQSSESSVMELHCGANKQAKIYVNEHVNGQEGAEVMRVVQSAILESGKVIESFKKLKETAITAIQSNSSLREQEKERLISVLKRCHLFNRIFENAFVLVVNVRWWIVAAIISCWQFMQKPVESDKKATKLEKKINETQKKYLQQKASGVVVSDDGVIDKVLKENADLVIKGRMPSVKEIDAYVEYLNRIDYEEMLFDTKGKEYNKEFVRVMCRKENLCKKWSIDELNYFRETASEKKVRDSYSILDAIALMICAEIANRELSKVEMAVVAAISLKRRVKNEEAEYLYKRHKFYVLCKIAIMLSLNGSDTCKKDYVDAFHEYYSNRCYLEIEEEKIVCRRLFDKYNAFGNAFGNVKISGIKDVLQMNVSYLEWFKYVAANLSTKTFEEVVKSHVGENGVNYYVEENGLEYLICEVVAKAVNSNKVSDYVEKNEKFNSEDLEKYRCYKCIEIINVMMYVYWKTHRKVNKIKKKELVGIIDCLLNYFALPKKCELKEEERHILLYFFANYKPE